MVIQWIGASRFDLSLATSIYRRSEGSSSLLQLYQAYYLRCRTICRPGPPRNALDPCLYKIPINLLVRVAYYVLVYQTLDVRERPCSSLPSNAQLDTTYSQIHKPSKLRLQAISPIKIWFYSSAWPIRYNAKSQHHFLPVFASLVATVKLISLVSLTIFYAWMLLFF